VTRTRLTLALLAALALAPPADGGVFNRKARVDAARARQLAEAVRSDPDERKRKAAAAELAEFDPRAHAEVVPALTAALQRDRSAAVRAKAAEAIGQFKVVFVPAGVALETAAELDPSPAVRDAARQALWEYHLNGYRSTRGADGIAGQTSEPPLARPAITRVQAVVPPPPTAKRPLDPSPPTASYPSVAALGPAAPGELVPLGPRTIVSAAPPPILNLTDEPPLARPGPAVNATARPAAVTIPPPDSVVPAPAPPPAPIPPTGLPTVPVLPLPGM
jgi:hypothetical protein